MVSIMRDAGLFKKTLKSIASSLRRKPNSRLPSECFAQLALGLVECVAAFLRQIAARAIDVEVEHRHRRLKRRALTAAAFRRRALERLRDRLGVAGFKNIVL